MMKLEGTVMLQAASQETWDVVVIGAGPAGAMAARQLGLHGARTLLIDRQSFPRWKVCGACINKRALSQLHTVGLGQAVQGLGIESINRLELWVNGRNTPLPMPGGIVASRVDFDACLVRAAIDAGVQFLPETDARLGQINSEFRTLRLSTRRNAVTYEVKSKVALVASGLKAGSFGHNGEFESRVQPGSRIGVGGVAASDVFDGLQGTIYMSVSKPGYVGLVRLHDGRWNIAAALEREAIRTDDGVGGTVNSILLESGILKRPLANEFDWRGTVPLTRLTTPVAAQRVFVLGDATGYVEPFTGEGIAWALDSAIQVTPLVQTALTQWSPGLIRQWTDCHQKMIRKRQWICHTVAAILRRPLLINASLRLLTRMPSLAAPVIRALNSPGLVQN